MKANVWVTMNLTIESGTPVRSTGLSYHFPGFWQAVLHRASAAAREDG